jgi:hypothetical protein
MPDRRLGKWRSRDQRVNEPQRCISHYVRWPSEAIGNRIVPRGGHCAGSSPNVNCSGKQQIIV